MPLSRACRPRHDCCASGRPHRAPARRAGTGDRAWAVRRAVRRQRSPTGWRRNPLACPGVREVTAPPVVARTEFSFVPTILGGCMRLLLRAGGVAGLAAMVACGKDAPSPVDFTDPAAVSANLSSVDSAFDSDVFRRFSTASIMLDVATAPAFRPAANLIETLQPKLVKSGARMFLPTLRPSQKPQAMVPNLSISAAQGRIIPDTMYGRVFEWDTALNQYRYQGTTVANLTGVRFG